MTNGEKYKTAKERAEAFRRFCDHECGACPLYNSPCHTENCQFHWLDLEAPAEKPLPCPFCGGEVTTTHGFIHAYGYVLCKECGYRSKEVSGRDAAIAEHNRVARAVAKVEEMKNAKIDLGADFLKVKEKEANDANA